MNKYNVPRYLQIVAIAISFCLPIDCIGQLQPSDLYMVNYSNVDAQFSIKGVSYLSDFNPEGYNNQPCFTSLNNIYISTDMYERGVTEIVKLDLYNETLERMTMSSESDFSPTSMPNGGFSTVRIESDGITQSLWAYNEDKFDRGHRLLEDISTIGYYKWLSDEDLAMFLLPEPFSLHLGNISNGTSRPIIENIGRCFRQDNEGNLLFTHKINDSLRYIKSYDLETNKAKIVCQALSGSEDFELIARQAILMAKGSAIYYFDPKESVQWTKVMDLKEYGIASISRIVASRGRVIIVCNNNE